MTETSRGVSLLTEGEQLELFPELSEEMKAPKNFAALENGNKTMRFVAEYFISNNATQSILKAGYNCTEESARRMGSKLLTRIDIQAALAYLDKQIQESAIVSKRNVIESILETRAKAAKAPGSANLRVVNECDRLLAQIRGMLREKLEVDGNMVGSLAEFKALVAAAKKEDSENAEKEQE